MEIWCMKEQDFKLLFGKKIRKLRKELNLSQESAAEEIGIETHNWSRIETGKSFPQPSNLVKIIQTLKVEPSELFDFSNKSVNSDIKYSINKLLDKHPDKVDMFYKILLAIVSKN